MIPMSAFKAVIEAILVNDPKLVKSATKYLAPDSIVRASRHCDTRRDNQFTLVLTYGKPNFEERKFVKLCQRAGQPFPVSKVQFKRRPVRRPRKINILATGNNYTPPPQVAIPGPTASARFPL